MHRRKALWYVAMLVIPLLALEAAARLVSTVIIDFTPPESAVLNGEEWVDWSDQMGWVIKPGFSGMIFNSFRRYDRHGFSEVDSAQVQSRAEPRVVMIGDSNTFGYGVSAEDTFAEVLDAKLSHASVINLGVAGHTSYQGVQVLRARGLSLQPRVVVVSFNFNDRRYACGQPDSPERMKSLAGALTFLSHVWLTKPLFALKGWFQSGEASNSRPGLDTAAARVSPEQYRENLIEVARLTKEQSIGLIFVKLSDNPWQTELLRAGEAQLDVGDTQNAISSFRQAASIPAFKGTALKMLAAAYERAGRMEEAKSLLSERRSPEWCTAHGGPTIFPDVTYMRIMEEVSAEYGATLVDAAAALNRNPGVYMDYCHIDKDGHRIVADLLAEAVSKHLGSSVDSLVGAGERITGLTRPESGSSQ
jgi:hypothetical protein